MGVRAKGGKLYGGRDSGRAGGGRGVRGGGGGRVSSSHPLSVHPHPFSVPAIVDGGEKA